MEQTILLHGITPEDLSAKIREIIRESWKQDQLLTKEGALKMAGVSNATLMKAINDGIIKPQRVKGRMQAMYLESEVVKLEKRRKSRPWLIGTENIIPQTQSAGISNRFSSNQQLLGLINFESNTL